MCKVQEWVCNVQNRVCKVPVLVGDLRRKMRFYASSRFSTVKTEFIRSLRIVDKTCSLRYSRLGAQLNPVDRCVKYKIRGVNYGVHAAWVCKVQRKTSFKPFYAA